MAERESAITAITMPVVPAVVPASSVTVPENGREQGELAAIDVIDDANKQDGTNAREAGSLADGVDDEIYAVFVEEFEEILARLQIDIPQWDQARDDTKLLTEIRRAFHTFKGSGRMLNRLALGDYGWAHEDMLNQVLAGGLPRSDTLAALLQRALIFLTQQQTFFLNSAQSEAISQAEVAAMQHFITPATTVTPAITTLPELPATHQPSEEQAPVSVDLPSATNLDTGLDTKPERVASAAEDEGEDSRIIWAMFREELPEQLQAIDQFMQDLYANANNTEAAQALERELHTLKGGARMAQLVEMADVAHEAEGLLIAAKQPMIKKAKKGRKHKVHNNQRRSSLDIELLQTQIDLISMLAEAHALSDMPTTNHVADTATIAAPSKEVPAEAAGLGLFSAVGQSAMDNKHYGSYLEQLLTEQAADLPDISVLGQLVAAEEQVAPVEIGDEQGAPLLTQEQVRLSASYLDKMIEDANTLNIEQHTLNERLHAIGEDVGEFSRTAARLKHLLRSLELETEARVHAGYRGAVNSRRSSPGLTRSLIPSLIPSQTLQESAGKGDSEHFDPLEMDEYSEVQRLSRALAESLNDLVNIEGDLNAQLRSAREFVKQSLYNSRGLHHDLLATRLVEVSVLAPRLRRILRQTAAELGQKVTLELSGEELKLDRHLLQRMTAPIEHLLRNAVSHGIESIAERKRLQKPEAGKIALSVYREENEVVFCIRDDGRGLDNARILQQARSMGLVTARAELSEQDIQRLILRPGFSTAEALNQIAGRGVGMDVVNAEVRALGGHLVIDSEPDLGAVFTIRLPFTMASNPVLFVAVQEQPYALPLGTIQGLNRVSGETLQHYLGQHPGQQEQRLTFNDEDYPVYYLGAALGYDYVPLTIRTEAMYPLVYTRAGGERIAWVVDTVQGRRDVILQSLGTLFKQCHFYASATITPEGQVVMVPDMPELTERVLTAPVSPMSPMSPTAQSEQQNSGHAQHDSGEDAVFVPPLRHQQPHIMVVDDSVTVRKVTEKFLLHENFRVVTVRDGLEALEKLDSFMPDLLLLDIEMPRMDGFELLSALRAHERWHSVPVIMVSSRTAEKHRMHALQLGANAFLGKPYQDQALLAHIARHLAKDGGAGADGLSADSEDGNAEAML